MYNHQLLRHSNSLNVLDAVFTGFLKHQTLQNSKPYFIIHHSTIVTLGFQYHTGIIIKLHSTLIATSTSKYLKIPIQFQIPFYLSCSIWVKQKLDAKKATKNSAHFSSQGLDITGMTIAILKFEGHIGNSTISMDVGKDMTTRHVSVMKAQDVMKCRIPIETFESGTRMGKSSNMECHVYSNAFRVF